MIASLILSMTMRTVTAYNSVPEQTSSHPCISADGSDICLIATHPEVPGTCAANFVPLGTHLVVVGKLGQTATECVVRDRTNRRYRNRVDLFMGYDVKAARKFGRQTLMVYILK